MDSSDARESLDSKAEFRKPSSDAAAAAANRKYRRRSPSSSSSSRDGSPHRERNSSPVPSRKDITRVADDKRKKDDGRNRSDRSGESYKYSDRQSSRSYHRHDDHSRRDRHVDDYDRGYSKSSSYNSGRRHANIEERDSDRDRQKDNRGERYGKTDHRKNSGDYKGDCSPANEESRGQRNDSSSRRDSSGYRNKEASSRGLKEQDAEKYRNDDKRRHDDRSTYKEQGNGDPKENSDDKSIKGQDSIAKRPKVFSLSSPDPATDGTSEQAVTDSDIDAAKIAAIKAAELVNRNLVGTGYMSTDQKKKLLWGNKKNTATEESAHRWDTTAFGDRDRQEKFHKLMSLRLPWYLLPIVGREGGHNCGTQGRQSRCRETAGATSDGLGEAIYSWIASERWPNSWTWSLKKFSRYPLSCISVFFGILVCMKKLV